VVVFTKFDGQVIQEYGKLQCHDMMDEVKWKVARENAEIIFQRSYLHTLLHTDHPPRVHVHLEGEDGKYLLLHT
jgi:hypothetical protein